MIKNRYSDETKAEALVILEANGGNVRRTAEQLGIPRGTLRNWSDGLGAPVDLSELGPQKKESLLDLFERQIREALNIPIATKNASLRDLAVYIGVLVDKYQLLSGRATQRIALNDSLSERSDFELDAIIREAEFIINQAASGETSLESSEN